MKNLLIILLIYITTLNAKVYENATDKKTKRWKAYNNISAVTIKNIYDKVKRSRVISFKSKDSRNGYMLSMERDSKTWCKTKGKSLRWSMRTVDDFVILISMQTVNGHRYIIYTPSDDKIGRGYYGLGKSSIDGDWHKFNRDLDLDLKRYEPENEIIAVDTFFIRAKEIRVDDIEIVNIKNVKKKHFVPKKHKGCNIYMPSINCQKDGKLKKLTKKDNVPPIIKLNGNSTIFIRLGEEYKEQGAIGIDNVDGRLNVEISGSVDINRVGSYTLFYMAKDKTGNTSMTTRIINVKGIPNEEKIKQEKGKDNQTKDKTKFLKDIDLLEFSLPSEDDELEEFGVGED